MAEASAKAQIDDPGLWVIDDGLRLENRMANVPGSSRSASARKSATAWRLTRIHSERGKSYVAGAQRIASLRDVGRVKPIGRVFTLTHIQIVALVRTVHPGNEVLEDPVRMPTCLHEPAAIAAPVGSAPLQSRSCASFHAFMMNCLSPQGSVPQCRRAICLLFRRSSHNPVNERGTYTNSRSCLARAATSFYLIPCSCFTASRAVSSASRSARSFARTSGSSLEIEHVDSFIGLCSSPMM